MQAQMDKRTTLNPDTYGIELVPVKDLIPYRRNAKRHSREQITTLADSLTTLGWGRPILTDGKRGIVAGHGMALAALDVLESGRAIPHWPDTALVPTVSLEHMSPEQRRAYIIADNRTAELAEWDKDMLRVELEDLAAAGFPTDCTGWSLEELLGMGEGDPEEEEKGSLAEQFLASPFTVFDARGGWWLERKRQWIASGINSLAGRAENLLYDASGDSFGARVMAEIGTTSVFDPVLTELAYRWFTPQGGTILDPFAGGSVRGIVAAQLGRAYHGIDLRPEQVEENRRQWGELESAPYAKLRGTRLPPDFTPDYTPVEQRGQYWFKRDDLFCVGGVRGGKVRTCYTLAEGATGVTTAGSRQSPQANIVAHVARRLGIPARVHTPSGELGPELEAARTAGAEVVQHKPGHNSVIIARARTDAAARGWREIPFGMECHEAVEATAAQVRNIPGEVTRIVMPVGSGMSLAGVLTGIQREGRNIAVLGVRVGADPTKRLDEYAPANWRSLCQLVDSPQDYHERAPITTIEGIQLDPIYEAKCLRFLEPGDMLWIVGLRQSEDRTIASDDQWPVVPPEWYEADSRRMADVLPPGLQADFVFSCPPYADLEVYSDRPEDLSNMDYAGFVEAYREIVAKAVGRLKQDRFAAFVVGDVRDNRGIYRNFVGDTIRAFEDAGARYYNEAVLITSFGSLAIRVGRMFNAARKLGKTHQNVLVFVKGDPKRAAEACGDPLIPDLAFPPVPPPGFATCPSCRTGFALPDATPTLEHEPE